jgi:hypothetical protein
VKHPFHPNTHICFPKLFPNEDWENQISSEGCTITEKNINPSVNITFMEKYLDKPEKRIVFPKVKGPLGETMYRFKGEFELSVEESKTQQCLVWKRIAVQVQTYS